ncbi:MAG: UvrD-helicase domain-containing protein [Oscillospiraceae bacterium]|nr:UvrD-helicase domain-containing protein [Oscillospiraceae bacterium]
MEFSKAVLLRKQYIEKQFGFLNPMQQQAVYAVKGPILILAGAGSGKTSVLINRISNMVRFGHSYASQYFPGDVSEETYMALENAVNSGEKLSFAQENEIATNPIRPYNILAITFTNKAAAELRERLEKSIGEYAKDVMASTFHSLCVRILRRDGDKLGFDSSFTIYDTDDQKRIIKEIMKDFNIDDKFVQLKSVMSRMSGYKDKLISPQQANEFSANAHEKLIVKCYEEYQKRLKKANAFDFDDLIYYTVQLFKENPDVLEYYQNRYRYVMVDEYQDTSTAQFELVHLLAQGHNNICVVGDDDQSIYRFRGATIENILSFEEHFEGAQVIRLEQNYRSTQNILNAANSVIRNNQGRKGKTLWTSQGDGEKVKIYSLPKEFDESRNIVDIIADNVKKGAKLSDHAVLYRMNMQSSGVENALARSGISYRIIGGHRFYDRAEIKDVLAYINVAINPEDDLRLKRIINVPARKIGNTTIETISNLAKENGVPMIEIIRNVYDYPQLSRAVSALINFRDIYEKVKTLCEECPMEHIVPNLIRITGYEDMLAAQGEEGKTRLENIGQLVSNMQEYRNNNGEDATLRMFLEEVSLISDIDNYDKDADSVTLMTIHSAKGLEFPYVFIVGVEEGIFPGEMSKYNPDDIEEERRLAYVGITRAKKELYISYCGERMVFGQTKRPQPSRFVEEIDKSVCDVIDRNVKRYNLESSFGAQSSSVMQYSRKPTQKATGFGQTSSIMGSTVSKSNVASKTAQKSTGLSFNTGDRISHKVFGTGTVLKITPIANDAMLEIKFDSVGVKKVMANFTPITKLN